MSRSVATALLIIATVVLLFALLYVDVSRVVLVGACFSVGILMSMGIWEIEKRYKA